MLSLIFPFYQLPYDGQQLKGGDMTARQESAAAIPEGELAPHCHPAYHLGRG